MKIDILCSDGSPLGVTEQTIWGDNFRVGVGGSELALLTMCRLWHDSGHQVVLYNDPKYPDKSAFEQRPVSTFAPNDNRDILIVFRAPNARAIVAKGKKVFWSCDQYTIGDFRTFAGYMQQIVCISPCHADYFQRNYGINNTVVIDLPVRVDEIPALPKIPNRMVFTSVPDRGLQNLWRIYPKIRHYFPDLTLAITSDYRLWGAAELNQQHRARWLVHDGIEFLGALPRKRYLETIAQAEIMVYPGNYEELFCISVAEAQAAGVVCVTSAKGSLATTNMGHIFHVDADNPTNDITFVDRAVQILTNRVQTQADRELIQAMALERFSPKKVLGYWDKHIFNGEK